MTTTPAPRQRASRRTAPLGAVALTTLLVVLLVLGGVVAFAPRMLGATPLAVRSHSMEPALGQGDLAVVQQVEPEQLEVGDIIAFRPRNSDQLVTRRIIEIVENEGTVLSLRTRGDGLPRPDVPIRPYQIEGRVAYAVPLVGTILQQPVLVAAIAVLGLGMLGVTIAAFFVPSMRFYRR